ncbi:hypothetical protein AB6F62_20630 [Providencia huaxiensis]|uniref:hypothetical protein n=1 Tax=Providencia TaxID=586 RepID=UPI001B387140|nr:MULTISPECIES: hypothetical protein [Providencia]EJD6370324.1 hypothetical protein [Providencia rettgeri]EJD6374746.1 hypothetical protein [Providencia rettgeri]ELR5033176.1 hypothetical protein [Providencia rettgeri]ELR5159940.1 hypothetical protein [Providencia rettgeri]ELR5209008.1 hypothetical protein [Providencia rettgeri]
MKRQLIQLVLLSISIFKIGDTQAHTPEQVVIAFQHDYKIWNDQTFQQSQSHEAKDITLLAQKSWNELLKKYTKPDFKGEPIVFGSESSHDPEQEKVIAIKITENLAIVTTKFTQVYYSPIYEYHLVKQNNSWYLSQIFLVDEDGKYPSL